MVTDISSNHIAPVGSPRKVLFIDRDGTLIVEPPETLQVNSLEELVFMPGVFTWLGRIAQELDYDLVMVTNQDGLGTESYPEEAFQRVQKHLMDSMASEGIDWKAVHIDRSRPAEQLPTRKPGTGMLKKYFGAEYDLPNSIVIGDRLTDAELAFNLGCQAILFTGSPEDGAAELSQAQETLHPVILKWVQHWKEIYEILRFPARTASIHRKTRETDVRVFIDLDGRGESQIQTGLGFFDHMLEQIARHGNIQMEVVCQGDLCIDEHHTIEDTAIAIGEAVRKALGNKSFISRYGFCLPMDDCLALVAIDFGGRPWLQWHAPFQREKIGDVPTELFFHFFKSFADAARCNLTIKAAGHNEHHKIEAIFKAFARSLRMAAERQPSNPDLPTTKGLF